MPWSTFDHRGIRAPTPPEAQIEARKYARLSVAAAAPAAFLGKISIEADEAAPEPVKFLIDYIG